MLQEHSASARELRLELGGSRWQELLQQPVHEQFFPHLMLRMRPVPASWPGERPSKPKEHPNGIRYQRTAKRGRYLFGRRDGGVVDRRHARSIDHRKLNEDPTTSSSG